MNSPERLPILPIIDRETTLTLIDFPGLITSAETAFTAQSEGKASPPAYINMVVDDKFAHFKAGYFAGSPYFVLKYSGGFWAEEIQGLPVDGGYVIVHNAKTGQPLLMFYDFGAITDYRTAAAGAVASKYLSREDSQKVGIIGTGIQARLQLEALQFVRPNIKEVRVWGRHPDKISQYIHDMSVKFPHLKLISCPNPESAVREVDILYTVTPSRTPIVKAAWISPGTHITAVGACAPYMQEHEPAVLAKANLLYADSIEKTSHDGEMRHALESSDITPESITGELGDLILSQKPGRTSPTQITFADLVGLGIQDATAATYLLEKYLSSNGK